MLFYEILVRQMERTKFAWYIRTENVARKLIRLYIFKQ